MLAVRKLIYFNISEKNGAKENRICSTVSSTQIGGN